MKESSRMKVSDVSSPLWMAGALALSIALLSYTVYRTSQKTLIWSSLSAEMSATSSTRSGGCHGMESPRNVPSFQRTTIPIYL